MSASLMKKQQRSRLLFIRAIFRVMATTAGAALPSNPKEIIAKYQTTRIRQLWTYKRCVSVVAAVLLLLKNYLD